MSRCRYAGWRDWGEKERGVLLVPALWAGRGFSRIPRTFLPHAHPQRKKERRTDRKQDWSRRSYRQATWCIVHGTSQFALVSSFVPHSGCLRPRLLLPTTHRNFGGHQITRHARARSHDLLTTYRVRMGRHVTTLITTVLSRCISQPIMRTHLPAIAAPVLTCPATP